MMQEYISVTYSNSKTWVCPHSWTRPWCRSGRPCQGWGRRWEPWRGRCHRRRGAPRTPSSPSPPAPAPIPAPASPSLTCLLVSWQENGMKPAQLLGLVESGLLENKGRKVESNTGWEKSKAGKQNKDRDWGGKAKAVGRWSQYHSFALLCYVFLASNVFFSHLASVGTMLSWTEWSLSSILPK